MYYFALRILIPLTLNLVLILILVKSNALHNIFSSHHLPSKECCCPLFAPTIISTTVSITAPIIIFSIALAISQIIIIIPISIRYPYYYTCFLIGDFFVVKSISKNLVQTVMFRLISPCMWLRVLLDFSKLIVLRFNWCWNLPMLQAFMAPVTWIKLVDEEPKFHQIPLTFTPWGNIYNHHHPRWSITISSIHHNLP